MIVKIKNVRLLPHQENEITAYYSDTKGNIVAAQEYNKPECLMNDISEIKNTNPFTVKKSFLKLVKEESKKANINPNLLTALIAQESGFNPNAVSYAKAVGLTPSD